VSGDADDQGAPALSGHARCLPRASFYLGQAYSFSITDADGAARASFDLGVTLGADTPTTDCVASVRVDA
jgi:hypothetical protein